MEFYMTISELIQKLNEIKEKEGDLKVVGDWESHYGYPDGASIVRSPKVVRAWSFDEYNMCREQWGEESEQETVLMLS